MRLSPLAICIRIVAASSLFALGCSDDTDSPDTGSVDAAADTGAGDTGEGDAPESQDAMRFDSGVDAQVDVSDAGPESLVLRERRAFPTAEGYGAGATGGRGGEILFVTTTEDTDEPGSLRWALRQEGPRIVYFLVGGAFVIDSLLYVDNGDLTIAGETALPLGGVHIYGNSSVKDTRVYFSDVENVIVRFVSIRGSWQAWREDRTRHNPMTLSGSYNTIFDHYSGGWGSYTGGSPSKVNDIAGRGGLHTIQWSLLHEGVSGHNVGGVGGIQMDYVRGSFDEEEHADTWAAWDGTSNHHNAFIGLTHRFFNTSGNGTVADQVVNNYIYGWGSRMSRHTNGNQPIDIFRNVYEAAGYNSTTSYARMHKFDFNDFYNLSPVIDVSPNFYLAENLIIERDGSFFQGPEDNNWPMLTHFGDTDLGDSGDPVMDESARRVTLSEGSAIAITIDEADVVKDRVLTLAGASLRFDEAGQPFHDDPIDRRYLDWAREGVGPDSISGDPGDGGLGDSDRFEVPDHVSETRARSELADDGTPLDWSPPADVQNDAGYSNLELYLAELAGDFVRLRDR